MRKIHILLVVLLVFFLAGMRLYADALPSPDYKIYKKNAPLEMVIQSGHWTLRVSHQEKQKELTGDRFH